MDHIPRTAVAHRPRRRTAIEATTENLREQYLGLEVRYERTLRNLEEEKSKRQLLDKQFRDLGEIFLEMRDSLKKEKVKRRKVEEQLTHLDRPLVSDRNKSAGIDGSHNIKEIGRKFVAVLIDADGYKFHMGYLRDLENGGKLAVDELLAQIRSYLEMNVPDLVDYDIVVRAYANLAGLGPACQDEFRMETDDLRPFVWDFNSQDPLVDFVDIGPGGQRADLKIQDLLEYYVSNDLCEHIFLGVCHDRGYIPFIEQTLRDGTDPDRMTLVVKSSVRPGYDTLGLRTTQMPTVFSIVTGTLIRPVRDEKRKTPWRNKNGTRGSYRRAMNQ
ncbi:MAG: hypothetical protein Q9198_000946 [Flavoplaca austrocitrina]